MSQSPIEPEVLAVAVIADALAAARVVPRRRIVAERVGVAMRSEIALPGDADYDADSPGGPLLRAVRAGTLRGMTDEHAALPAAWVNATGPANAEPAAAMDGGRVGDDPFDLELLVVVRALDQGDEDVAGAGELMREGSTLLLRHRLLDLWRRLRTDARPIAISGGDGGDGGAGGFALHAWSQAWSGDYRECFLTARVVASLDGEQIQSE